MGTGATWIGVLSHDELRKVSRLRRISRVDEKSYDNEKQGFLDVPEGEARHLWS